MPSSPDLRLAPNPAVCAPEEGQDRVMVHQHAGSYALLAQPRVERARPAWREPVNHGKVVRAVLAVTILVISVVFALTESPRLGLDLRGGTQITLETRDSLAVKADRGVHRMDPGGAAPSCRRARCRRTGYRPVR